MLAATNVEKKLVMNMVVAIEAYAREIRMIRKVRNSMIPDLNPGERVKIKSQRIK